MQRIGWKAGCVMAAAALFGVSNSATFAQMLRSEVPVRIVVVGGSCLHDPDLLIDIPTAGNGHVERNSEPTKYVVTGDRIPAQISMSIGLRAEIEGYGPGRIVTVMIVPPVGRTGHWETEIDPTGSVDFGRSPAAGMALPEGRYLLSVLDNGTYLFTYAITLDGIATEGPCAPIS